MSTDFNTILGTDTANTLIGTSGADSIVALSGNDTVNGQGGADIISAGFGNDVVIMGTPVHTGLTAHGWYHAYIGLLFGPIVVRICGSMTPK